MSWKRHSYPKRRKTTPKDPYKSGLERRLADILQLCYYEKVKVKYTVPHTYNPDFGFPDKPWLLIEAKGRFINGSAEAKKYVEVAKQHRELEIVFILENPNTKAYPQCKPRKDGSIMTIGEWCAKNKFCFYHEKKIPDWFIIGDFDRDMIKEETRLIRQEWLGVI